jgi:hypothetical protein
MGGARSEGGTSGTACRHGVVQITSLIDGRDWLTISPDALRFEHLTWAGPGLETFRTEPTSVDTTFSAVSSHIDWCPIWANGCNTCDGSCGELRVEDILSDPLPGLFFPGPITNLEFSCTGAEGRWLASCGLAQLPTAANGYNAIIDFDDDAAGGPAHYTARLSFDYAIAPSASCDGGTSGGGTSTGGTSGGGTSGGTAGNDEGGSGASGGEAGAAVGGTSSGGTGSEGECKQRGQFEAVSLIDGSDRLIITPSQLAFNHYDWAGPGMESFRKESTALDVTFAGTTEHIDWCPIWENGCNTCDGSCGELRIEDIDSLPLSGEFFRGCMTNVEFSCTGAEARPFASCTLSQAPASNNGYTAIVDIDDDAAGGPAYYSVRLSYEYTEGPACGCYESDAPPAP